MNDYFSNILFFVAPLIFLFIADRAVNGFEGVELQGSWTSNLLRFKLPTFEDLRLKTNPVKNKLWLCLPIIVCNVLDKTVTLLGQPVEYWNSSYTIVNEWNPVARLLLTMHPLAYIISAIPELIIISILIILLPTRISKSLSIFYTIGSAKAFYNWMINSLNSGWIIPNLLLVIPSFLLVYAFEKVPENKISG
jgi:hypothetical protein